MATVNYFHYDHVLNPTLKPGEDRVWTYGPYSWSNSAVSATAIPTLDFFGDSKQMSVTEIRLLSAVSIEGGVQDMLTVRVKNTGVDPISGFSMSIGLIEP